MKHQIIVTANIDEKVDIQIAQIDNEKRLNFQEMSHVLVDAISLLIKLANEECEMKDYQLMEEVVEHLNHNFASTKAFNDAKIFTKYVNKKDEKV
jgi:hypothetical protein